MSVVYFAAQGGRIKIGTTTQDPRNRLAQLNCSLPERLELIGCIVGDWRREHELHRAFRAFNLRGEWFRDCEELRAEIDLLLKQFRAPPYKRPPIERKLDPQAFGRVLRLMWPNDAVKQLHAFTGEPEDECIAWLTGNRRPRRILRHALSNVVTRWIMANDADGAPDFINGDEADEA